MPHTLFKTTRERIIYCRNIQNIFTFKMFEFPVKCTSFHLHLFFTELNEVITLSPTNL